MKPSMKAVDRRTSDSEFEPLVLADWAQLDDELPDEPSSDEQLPEEALACLVGLHGDTHVGMQSATASIPLRNRLLSSYGSVWLGMLLR